mgnify:CR=1 FL=1
MADEQIKTEDENTETQDNQIQEEPQEKLLTQEEFDDAFKKRLAREKRKLEKQFEGIDPEEARQLKAEKEEKEKELALQRGEYDKIIKETVTKKDEVIGQYKQQLTKVLVSDVLIRESSEQGAIKPTQIEQLLSGRIKLGDDGQPEVLGDNGMPMYDNKGEPMSVKQLVSDFLNDNPHFVSATPSGAGSQGNVGSKTPKAFNMAELNMANPEDRKAYAEYRRERDKKPSVIDLTK